MSWQATAAVLDAQFPDVERSSTRRRGVTGQTMKLVALAMADPARADGTDARPGLRRCALRASVTIDTARIALDALVELRVAVLVELSDGRSPDRYDLDLAQLAAMKRPVRRAALSRALPTPASRARRSNDPTTREHRCGSSPTRRRSTHAGVSPRSSPRRPPSRTGLTCSATAGATPSRSYRQRHRPSRSTTLTRRTYERSRTVRVRQADRRRQVAMRRVPGPRRGQARAAPRTQPPR